MKIHKTFSSEETQKLGEEIARQFAGRKARRSGEDTATIIALQGDLGAGKTTFTQGFLRGLGIKRRATSPTFIIMRRYKFTGGDLFHFDAYRLKQAGDLEALEFKLITTNPKNIILIEWPERIKEILPKNTTWIKFAHGKKENQRRIAMR